LVVARDQGVVVARDEGGGVARRGGGGVVPSVGVVGGGQGSEMA